MPLKDFTHYSFSVAKHDGDVHSRITGERRYFFLFRTVEQPRSSHAMEELKEELVRCFPSPDYRVTLEITDRRCYSFEEEIPT